MKCPVCDNVNRSMVCLKCGFDGSTDYGKYPAFGGVNRTTSVSGLRKQWEATGEHVAQVPAKRRRLLPLLIAAVFAVAMGLGIWIGTGLGGGQGESVQVQKPPETTNQTAPPETTDQTTPPETTDQTTPPETTEPDPPVQIIEAEPWRKNILRSDVLPTIDLVDYGSGILPECPIFGSEYKREDIGSVHFLDTLADAPEDAWDVSQAEDGSVLAWVIPSGELYDLYIGAEGGVNAPQNCKGLFAGYINAQRIDFDDAFHTVNVQNMAFMFYGSYKLTELNLNSFDTSNVQSMSNMFRYCHGLTDLTLGNFDTSNVWNMGMMFTSCDKLSELNLSSFDTSNVQSMYWMFHGCESLTKLTLSERFITTNAKTDYMFLLCPAGDDYQHLVH